MSEKITIYGCGRVGEAIAEYFPNASKIRSTTPKEEKKRIVAESDWVFLTLRAKIDYTPAEDAYEMRCQELKTNLPHIGEFVDYAQFSYARIVVVTNPVDLFRLYIQRQLPRTKVYAFGLDLDRLRFSEYLGKPLEVMGIHGDAVPLLGKNEEKIYTIIMNEVAKESIESFLREGLDYKSIGKVFYDYFRGMGQQKPKPRPNKLEKQILDKIMRRFFEDYERMCSLDSAVRDFLNH